MPFLEGRKAPQRVLLATPHEGPRSRGQFAIRPWKLHFNGLVRHSRDPSPQGKGPLGGRKYPLDVRTILAVLETIPFVGGFGFASLAGG